MQHNRTKEITSSNAPVTLAALEYELASFYAGLVIVLEECFKPNAGRRMLGMADDESFGDLVARVDVRSTRIGKMLPVWFRYAYQGVLTAGFELHDLEEADGPYERLKDMLVMLPTDEAYFEWCLMGANVDLDAMRQGSLEDLTRRVDARDCLDSGGKLSLGDLAVLASMNERSVRNAIGAEGDSRLVVGEDSLVSNEEAKRWLGGRRGFVASRQRELPPALDNPPETLEAIEIPIFIHRRLAALWRPADEDTASNLPEGWICRAAREASMSVARIKACTELPLDVAPSECAGLAQALRVDPVWFNYQVMAALFPQQVDMLLNPGIWRDVGTVSAGPRAITIELTLAMLTHGYLDMPASAKALFPDDALGGRGNAERGKDVELVYGTHRVETDIRIKSEKTISPRRRFEAWFRTELGAKVGDRIRIERTAERVYTLSHLIR